MVYETFLDAVIQQLQQRLGEDYQLHISSVPKNNGVSLEGLQIHAPGAAMGPIIYLRPYFEQYERGMTLDDIIADILHLFYRNSSPDIFTEEGISSLKLMQSKIMFKIIHAASNAELLTDIPHIPYLDLAVIFYLFLDRSSSGQVTALIRNTHMNLWNVQINDLWKFAVVNTPLEFPAEIKSMSDMMKEIAHKNLGVDYDETLINEFLKSEENISPLYILSNRTGIYGAGCMLYKDLLKTFADDLGKDLIILPSSIHEVLITPDIPGASYEDLSSMVTCINQHEVPLEDQLSNQIYLYTRTDDRLRIASHAVGLTEFSSLD